MIDDIKDLLNSKKISFVILEPVPASEKKICVACRKKEAHWKVDGFELCSDCSRKIAEVKSTNKTDNIN